MQYCYNCLKICYLWFFIRLSIFKALCIIVSLILTTIALIRATIKSFCLCFKNLNSKWIAFTTLFFSTFPSLLTYKSNCWSLSWYWYSLLPIIWHKAFLDYDSLYSNYWKSILYDITYYLLIQIFVKSTFIDF